MWEEFPERAQKLRELEQNKDTIEQDLAELKANTFGTDSEETEEKARTFFENVGTGEGSGLTEEIDDTKKELSRIEQRIDELEEEILRELTDVQFPFNETIDQREGEVALPFVKELPAESVEVITRVMKDGGNTGSIKLEQSALVAKTEDVSEAIDEAQDFAQKLRKSAQHELNTEDYATELADRDDKIQRMLYELYESDEPLAKKELEIRTGVGKGGLRGVLYHVHDNEPYLAKEDNKHRLSDIGEDVVEKFLAQFGVPEKPEREGDSEESGDKSETQMSRNSGGDANE